MTTSLEFLAALHEIIKPKVYLEVGVQYGRSLNLAHAAEVAIGIDPNPSSPPHGNQVIMSMTSDDYFMAFKELVTEPIDFGYIDGMHLAEFAYRDFLNVERLAGNCGVVVLDDMLPRNVDEAARDRHTGDWAGDVFKMIGILRERRPDLVVLPVNTAPERGLVITALDPSSTVLRDSYEELLPQLESADPQDVPEEIRVRSASVSAKSVLASTAWKRLVELREADADRQSVARAVAGLRRLKRLG